LVKYENIELIGMESRANEILNKLKLKKVNSETKDLLKNLKDPKYLTRIHKEDKND
jgi:hypothetical protein